MCNTTRYFTHLANTSEIKPFALLNPGCSASSAQYHAPFTIKLTSVQIKERESFYYTTATIRRKQWLEEGRMMKVANKKVLSKSLDSLSSGKGVRG